MTTERVWPRAALFWYIKKVRRCPTTTAHNGLFRYGNIEPEGSAVLGVNNFTVLADILSKNNSA